MVAFDLLVLFEVWFPGLLPSPVHVPSDFYPTVAREDELERSLDGNPEAAKVLRLYTTARTNKDLAPVLDLCAYILGELQRRWGGNAFDNRDTLYGGLGDDGKINRAVKRYAADPPAQAKAVRDYTPTGKIERPLLSVRTVYDPLIGSFRSDRYAETVQSIGRGSVRPVLSAGAGHCEIPLISDNYICRSATITFAGPAARPDGGVRRGRSRMVPHAYGRAGQADEAQAHGRQGTESGCGRGRDERAIGADLAGGRDALSDEECARLAHAA